MIEPGQIVWLTLCLYLLLTVQDNQCLQGRLAQVNSNEEKSIQEELSILEEVRYSNIACQVVANYVLTQFLLSQSIYRQGQMCCRCLRLVDPTKIGESPMENGSDLEDDDLSLYELLNSFGHQPKTYRNEVTVQVIYPTYFSSHGEPYMSRLSLLHACSFLIPSLFIYYLQ